MRIIYAAILLILAVGVGIFCIQNLHTVSLTFLNSELTLPLPILVLVLYVLGMVTGWGLLSFLRKSLRKATETHAKNE